MEYFHRQYPDDEFYFIIGADSLMAIESWVHPERLFPTCTILATYRDEVRTKADMFNQIKYLNQKYHAQIRLLETSLMPVSSHELRTKMQAGLSVSAYIPASVDTYIREQNLYSKEGNK